MRAKTTIAEHLVLDELFELVASRKLRGIPIGRIIFLLRRRLRMSQRTLAKRAGVLAGTISRIESGKAPLSFTTLRKVFTALFCDFAIIPIPQKDLDLIVKEQIHRIAKKRVRYVKGTMVLELQQPKESAIQKLIAKEELELQLDDNLDIWKENADE